jgi:hydrogenase expression/formation protein HypC
MEGSMCLAIPGKIISIKDKIAQVDFNGTRREVSLDLVSDAKKNDYILAHAGFAIQVLEEKDAIETLKIFREIYDPTTSFGPKVAPYGATKEVVG